MTSWRDLLRFRLSDESFDARLVKPATYLASIGLIPLGMIAVLRHADSRADVWLGSGMVCLLSLLCVMMGTVCHRNLGPQETPAWRKRRPEFVCYLVCIGTLFLGVGLVSRLGMTPAQITLGLLVIGSLSLSVLVFGMTITLMRSQNG